MKVSAIRSTHIAGHASYRVDTPAGSVVIGGDAGNDMLAPPRASSTSDQVEKLAKGADIIVHSAIHPIMGPDRGSAMPPLIFYRQSTTSDLGAMAKRVGAKHLMLTHLSPPIGAERQGPWKVPGGALTEADYRKVVQESGFTGNIIVGTDLASIRLPYVCFLCRFSAAGNDEPLHALWRPAAEKRQGTKSRAMVQRRCRRRYGDLATGYGLRRLERSACNDRLSAK